MNPTKTDTLFVSTEDFIPQFYWLSIINILSNLIIPLVGLVDAVLLGHLPNIEDLAGVFWQQFCLNIFTNCSPVYGLQPML